MLYFWRGCGGNLKLVTLGSERVERADGWYKLVSPFPPELGCLWRFPQEYEVDCGQHYGHYDCRDNDNDYQVKGKICSERETPQGRETAQPIKGRETAQPKKGRETAQPIKGGKQHSLYKGGKQYSLSRAVNSTAHIREGHSTAYKGGKQHSLYTLTLTAMLKKYSDSPNL